jgi:TolB-like protein
VSAERSLNVSLPASEHASTSAPVRPSIAVLRFANLGGDPEQQYFADGMVEEVLTGLSRIKGLSVIARNSSFAFSSAAVDVRKIASELGARYVLEGSVRKSGDRVRVTAQLIEAESARNVWSDRYDRKLEEVFALQDDLAMSVVAAIEPNLRAAEIERVKRKRPDNLDAYDLLLRALPLIYPAMPEGAAKGVPLIEKAIAKEPDYAQAHGFAAWGHEIMFTRGGGNESNRLAAIRHAEKALAHGRDDAIALALGGFVMGVVARDRVVARQAFGTALELSSSCALAYMLGSVVYAIDGDASRAIEWGEEALRLSPRDPIGFSPLMSITMGHIARGDDNAAFAAAQKTMHANPAWTTSHILMTATQARLGRADGAKASAARVLELQPGFTISGFCKMFGLAPSLATPISDSLRRAGLDE